MEEREAEEGKAAGDEICEIKARVGSHLSNSETVVAFCVDFNASLLISCPYRRCKLRVLDLRNTGQSFWSMWSGSKASGGDGIPAELFKS